MDDLYLSSDFLSLIVPFRNILGIIPSAPITIGITVTIMFYSFFSSLARSRYLLSLVVFLVFIRYSFLIFLFIFMGSAFQYSPVFVIFLFHRAFWFVLHLVVMFLPLFVVFSLFIIYMAHFSMPNFIPISWLHTPGFIFGKQVDILYAH